MASACCSAWSAPDRRKVKSRMIHGAPTMARTVMATTATIEVVTRADTDSQASSSRFLRSSSTSTGMKTDVRTPPRISS